MVDAAVTVNLFNNLWVLLCGALVFIMMISVGLLEIGELGHPRDHLRAALHLVREVLCRDEMVHRPGRPLPRSPCGGLLGVLMIAFFTQHLYAVGSGNANLPDGILFAGGVAALRQLGIEILGILAVMVTVFILSYLTVSLIGRGMNGITTDYREEGMADPE